MSGEKFLKKLLDKKINHVLVKLDKDQFAVDLDAVLLPDRSTLVLLMNLNLDGDQYRLQPWDTTLNAIKDLRGKLSKVQALLFHDDFKDYLFLSDLNFVDNYLKEKNTGEGNGRRSIRIPKPTAEDIKKVLGGEIIQPDKNLLTGSYASYDSVIVNLVPNMTEKIATTQVFKNSSASNIVLYGPPGTGKTRGAILLADKMMKGEKFPTSSTEIQEQSSIINSSVTRSSNWYSVQFHPSFSYEDFFEGLRPVQSQNDGKSDLSYDVIPGVFKVVSQVARASLEAGKYGIEVKATFQDGSIESWLKSSGGIAELYRFKERNGYFELNGDKLYQTGVDAKELKKYSLVENFNGSTLIKWFSSDKAPEQFIFFIDELNRGNPAKIFGEALSLVELSKRYGADEPSFLNLPYSHERFSVPINLSLICAMNSSDKSLAHIDQAFRRRFKFMYLGPHFDFIGADKFINTVLEGKIKTEIVKGLIEYFKLLNESLAAVDISIDNHIGHSFIIDILKKALIVVKNNEKSDQQKLIGELVVRFWDFELHGLLRDILSQHIIDDFVEQYFSRLLKKKDDFKFIVVDEKLKDELKKYLRSGGAEDASAFLKAA